MMIHNPYRQLSFARVGTNMWHWVTTSFLESEYSDCIFHDGAFYAINRAGGIHRYTIEGSCARRDIILKDISPYIAHSVYMSRMCCKYGDRRGIRNLSLKSCEQLALEYTKFILYKNTVCKLPKKQSTNARFILYKIDNVRFIFEIWFKWHSFYDK
jgi:hypothetical protein